MPKFYFEIKDFQYNEVSKKKEIKPPDRSSRDFIGIYVITQPFKLKNKQICGSPT